jgi:hypothetical protein
MRTTLGYPQILACALTIAINAVASMAGADEDVLESLQEAKQDLTAAKCVLRYQFHAGETLSYTLEQLATIDTTISGNNQKTQLRSKSWRSLQVESVADDGNIRFSHTIDQVDMWSEVSGRDAVRYSSKDAGDPPPEYQHIAQHIGKPISIITMTPLGAIVSREDKVQHPDLGLGGLSIPLPEGEITVGHSWSQPIELKVRLDDQRIQTIKTRELYRLEKVETGVATISIKTQILTPVDDPRVKSQIVQRISQGELRFDIDAGRLLSKELNWDEHVLGFNGAGSSMKYLAKFSEALIPKVETASLPQAGQE